MIRTLLSARPASCSWILLPLLAGAPASVVHAQDSPRPPVSAGAPATLTALEASPQVLGGRGAGTITLSLPPGAVPPPNARIGIFQAGTSAKVAELSRPFTRPNNAEPHSGLQAMLSLDAEPGLYDIRLLRGDKSRAPLTQSATVSVAGLDREPGWWLFNGSPILRAQPTLPDAAALYFWPSLRRTLSKSDKARSANTRANLPVYWNTLDFPPLTAWLSDAASARETARELARRAQEARAGGLVGCEMFAAPGAGTSPEDVRALAEADPQSIVRAVQAAREEAKAIAPGAPLILGLSALSPNLAARVIDLAAPECDAVHIDAFDASDAAALWPLKAARRVAEEQPEFDLPIFVTPRDQASAIEAWMSGATGLIANQDSAQVLLQSGLACTLEANLSLFVGSVTLEDSGLLRAGDALTLFRRMREIGRVPLLARTFEVASRRDHSNREGRRNAEPFALRWTNGTPPSDLLTAIRDATRDGSRVYFEGNPFAAAEAPGFDAQAWRDVLQASVRPVEGASSNASTPASTSASGADDYAAEAGDSTASAASSSGRASELKLQDVWTFGLARGQSVAVQQSIVATPSRTPSAAELGDAPFPKGQSDRDRERIRPAPRVAAILGDGSPGTLISPSASSLRRDDTGNALPRGEVVWTPHLPRPGAASSTSGSAAGSLAAYDASISTLLQPALVRLFDRDAAFSGGASDGASDGARPEARGVRVCVRASARGTLLLALINPSSRARSLSVQTQAAGGYALDLAQNRVVPTRTRALRVEMDVDVPAQGFRLIAVAEDARKFEADRNAARLKAKAR